MTHAIGFGANKLAQIERRRIATGTFTVELPKPLSVNNLFATYNNRRIPTREYKAWRNEAAQMLMAQRARCAVGPVEITITVQESRGDLDNRLKCCIDALVENGIIDGDTSKTVRKITAMWGNVMGALVEVRPAEQQRAA